MRNPNRAETPASPVGSDASPVAPPPEGGLFAPGCACPVMTFNLKFGTYELNPWEERRPIMRRLLQRYRPRFLGVQEALAFQIDDLLQDLGGYASIGVSRLGTDEDEYSALLYDTTGATLHDSGTFWLSDTPDVPGSSSWGAPHPRIATWGAFRLPGSTRRTYVFNTHLSFLPNVALKNAQALVEGIERIVEPDAETVVMGDFNAPREGDAWEPFQTAGFRDAWQIAEHCAGPSFTFHDWQGEGAALDERIIDWILYRPPGDAMPDPASLRVEVITTSENGIYPSDHFPVALTRIGEDDVGPSETRGPGA